MNLHGLLQRQIYLLRAATCSNSYEPPLLTAITGHDMKFGDAQLSLDICILRLLCNPKPHIPTLSLFLSFAPNGLHTDWQRRREM
jgi:hypothetical protein